MYMASILGIYISLRQQYTMLLRPKNLLHAVVLSYPLYRLITRKRRCNPALRVSTASNKTFSLRAVSHWLAALDDETRMLLEMLEQKEVI